MHRLAAPFLYGLPRRHVFHVLTTQRSAESPTCGLVLTVRYGRFQFSPHDMDFRRKTVLQDVEIIMD